MNKLIEISINSYDKCRKYLENMDLLLFILIVIVFLYFLMYLISFFFKLPVIMLIGAIIGYYIYKQKNNKQKNNKEIKII